MEQVVQPALAFIALHSGWAAAVVFITAFGESFAFLSLLFPGTSMVIAAGALISVGSLPYLPVLAAAVLGAVLGDAAAYWIVRRFDGAVGGLWPFSRHPDLLANGTRFFARRFWVANAGSAIVWGRCCCLPAMLSARSASA
jgi:membrane protein DedA with SNARE-associated domain